MWIKKSPEELQKVKGKNRLVIAICIFLLSATFFTFCKPGSADRLFTPSQLFTPGNLIAERIPFALLFGAIISLIYFYVAKDKSVLVCPECEEVKAWDGVLSCDCGGHFEDLKTMKWVEVTK